MNSTEAAIMSAGSGARKALAAATQLVQVAIRAPPRLHHIWLCQCIYDQKTGLEPEA